MNKTNRTVTCPGSTSSNSHTLKSVHCDADVTIIGKLDRKTNTWIYFDGVDVNNYDFIERCYKCHVIVGINKK